MGNANQAAVQHYLEAEMNDCDVGYGVDRLFTFGKPVVSETKVGLPLANRALQRRERNPYELSGRNAKDVGKMVGT